MKVGKTLVASVMVYVPLMNFGRIIERLVVECSRFQLLSSPLARSKFR